MLEIITKEIELKTRGNTQIVDITSSVQNLLSDTNFSEGQVSVFARGSTGGITTIEYEPGLLEDLPNFLEKIIPQNKNYEHNKTWHDGNGYAHLRSALIKTSLTVPFADHRLLLGTWQQIIFIDFDNRPRHRTLIAQFIGTKKMAGT